MLHLWWMRFNLLFYCFFPLKFVWICWEWKSTRYERRIFPCRSKSSSKQGARAQKPQKYFTSRHVFRPNFQSKYHEASNSFSLLEAPLLVVAKHKNKSKRRYYLSCSARVIYGHELFAFRNRNINRFEYLFQQQNAIKALCEHSHSSGC